MDMADNLTTFMRRLSGNLEALTSWNPVIGLCSDCFGFLLFVWFIEFVCNELLQMTLWKHGCFCVWNLTECRLNLIAQ